MCHYKFVNEERCTERAARGSSYCILHVDLANITDGPEFQRIAALKEDRTRRKIQNRDFNFEGAKLVHISLTTEDEQTNADLNFENAKIKENATFSSLKIQGNVLFDGAEIGGDLNFMR